MSNGFLYPFAGLGQLLLQTLDKVTNVRPFTLKIDQASLGLTDNGDGTATLSSLGGGGGGGGSVTSVAMTVPSDMTVSGSPVTTSGTLAVTRNAQSGNTVVASPSDGSSGTPAFRALVAADIPAIAESGVTNLTSDLAAKLAATGGSASHLGVTDYVDATEIAAPSSPGSGKQRLYVDSTSHAVVRKNSGGTATPLSDVGHTHAESDVTSLTTDLTAKLAKTGGTADHPTLSDYADLADQGSDPASPSSGFHRFYGKSGGLYVKNSSGTIVGALGAGGSGLTLQELDGTPSGSPSTLKFPNGTLTDNGDGSYTYTPAAGGLTHTYLGYNTIGASTETVTAFRWYLKKVTVSTAGIITSVSVYYVGTADGATPAVCVGVWEDNAGSPRYVFAGAAPITSNPDNVNGAGAGVARWFHLPIGYYAAAGDYWIGVQFNGATAVVNYDGSGTDKFFTSTFAGTEDAGYRTVNTSANKYSIRASLIN